MYYLTRTEYKEILSGIKTFPYNFPPLSLKEQMNKYPIAYMGFVIWCIHGLPEPRNETEEESLQMLKDFLKCHLRLIDDSEVNEYTLALDL